MAAEKASMGVSRENKIKITHLFNPLKSNLLVHGINLFVGKVQSSEGEE